MPHTQSETVAALRFVIEREKGAILGEVYGADRATLTVDQKGYDAAAAVRRAGFRRITRRANVVKGTARYDVYVSA